MTCGGLRRERTATAGDSCVKSGERSGRAIATGKATRYPTSLELDVEMGVELISTLQWANSPALAP
jgi:hypothetical protein